MTSVLARTVDDRPLPRPTVRRLTHAAGLTALVGRVGFHVAREKALHPRPTTLREVPAGIDGLTTEWLSLALCDGTPGAHVTGFTFGPVNDGTSSRRTMTVTYDEAGTQAHLPTALFTKSAPTFLNRMVGAGARLSQIEAAFYATVRPTLEIEAPATHYSGFDPVSHRQMLIIEDVSVTRGAAFGSALNRTLTRDQADQLVDTLADLHRAFWNAPLRRMFGTWLESSYDYLLTLNMAIGAKARIVAGFDRARAVIPPAVYDRRHELHPALMESQRLLTRGPQTFLHGDVHPGNWYVTADGRMGLYDWQMCVIGGPARDLAYVLSTHLPVEDRRAWERDLLTRYLDRLGVPDAPTFDALWLSYRQQICWAMLAWLATIGRSPLQPAYQPDEISLANLDRIAQAFADLETIDAVDAP